MQLILHERRSVHSENGSKVNYIDDDNTAQKKRELRIIKTFEKYIKSGQNIEQKSTRMKDRGSTLWTHKIKKKANRKIIMFGGFFLGWGGGLPVAEQQQQKDDDDRNEFTYIRKTRERGWGERQQPK